MDLVFSVSDNTGQTQSVSRETAFHILKVIIWACLNLLFSENMSWCLWSFLRGLNVHPLSSLNPPSESLQATALFRACSDVDLGAVGL